MSTSKENTSSSVFTSYLRKRSNKSTYRGFLIYCRDEVINLSPVSKEWFYLDDIWSIKFLKEAENLESNEINFDDLKETVNTERSQHKKFLQTFWKGVIKECEKKNQPATEPKKKGKKQRLTELEFLSAIPPTIYYPDLDKSTTTTKSSTARTPSPVKLWNSFLEEVNSYQLDDNIKRYSRPIFKSYDKSYDISNEEDVRGALKNNVFDNLHIITTSRQPIEVFKRISKEDNVIGEPDFIYKRIGKLLLPIEVKTLWVLYLEGDESLHKRYEYDLERKKCEILPANSSREISVVDILRQIFGYLVANQLQYGILTTYNQHWFLRRPKNEPRALYISPTVEIESKDPSIFQCYSYIQHLSRTDTECPSPGETSPSSPSSFSDNESSDNNISSGSDYEESPPSSPSILYDNKSSDNDISSVSDYEETSKESKRTRKQKAIKKRKL
ncbi:9503_t:CDS:2 [Funneliformis geosporum]|uniref:16419_t:CDS:1 n=1 Tax=Funneliformis geosporum TaxID=1117311 RepID=A0A9W4T224_9GLOM|nr:16419_t:CDS:2 [Funneliformis geosporum]CAI2191038.1 9503_t:CDS:2 [Funneliformis geosporum]